MDVIEKRRSNYDLENNIELSKKDLINLLRKIVYYSPSPFNVQSSKVVFLNKKSHNLLWNTVVEEYLKKNNNGELLDSEKARILDFMSLVNNEYPIDDSFNFQNYLVNADIPAKYENYVKEIATHFYNENKKNNII